MATPLAPYESFETLKVSEIASRVLNVQLNRPDANNALSLVLCDELKLCFEQLADDKYFRVAILTASGDSFCSGVDIKVLNESLRDLHQTSDFGRRCLRLKQIIRRMQAPIQLIHECPKPVIAAIHSGCLGAGLDLCSAADIR